MAVNDFSNQNIQDTYQRVVQTDGTNVADGTGSLLPISFEGNNVIIPGALKAQSYIVSESIINVSSGSTVFGNSSDDTHTFTGNISSSGQIDADRIRTGGRIASSIFDIACVGPIDTDSNINCTGFSNSSTTSLNGRVDIFGAGSYVQTPSYISASQLISSGNITASGDISASGNLTAANTFTTNLTLDPSSDSIFKIFSADLTTITHEFHGRGNVGSFLAIPTTHRLGIGLNNDEAPQAKLHVSGNISASGDVNASNVNVGTRIYFVNGLTGNSIGGLNPNELNFAGSDVVRFQPHVKLDSHLTASGDISASRIIASKATINEGLITVTGSSTSHGFQLSRDGLDTYKIRHLDGGLTIQNSSDSRKEMTFDGTGNVGIGTTSPTSKLQVEGSISASSFIRANGSGQFGNLIINTNSLTTSQNDTTSLTLQSETINIKVNDDDFIDLEFDEQLIKMFKKTRFSSDINVLSNITASGNISASGHLNIAGITSSGDVHVDQYIYHDGDLTNYHRFLSNRQIFVVGNDSSIDLNNGVSTFGVASKATTVQGNELNLTGPITASGNISASGTIEGDGLLLSNNSAIFFEGIGVISKGGSIEPLIFASDTELQGKTKITGPVTASGNISASGTGSFGRMLIGPQPIDSSDDYMFSLSNGASNDSNKRFLNLYRSSTYNLRLNQYLGLNWKVNGNITHNIFNTSTGSPNPLLKLGLGNSDVAHITTYNDDNSLNLDGSHGVHVLSNLTASGDISASGRIYGRQLEQHDMGAGSFAVSQTFNYFPFGGQSHVESTSATNQNIQKLSIVPGKPIKVVIRAVTPGNGLGNTGYTCSYHSTGLVPGAPGTLKLIGEQRANSTGTNHETVTFDFTGGVTSGSYDDVLPGERVYMALQSDTSVSSITVLGATALWEWDYNSI